MSTKPQLSTRLRFVDVTRGLAVLCMLVLHSAHGWVRPEARQGDFWYWVTWIGGMAAPLFFLLLGLSFGLRSEAADRAAGRMGQANQVGRAVRRELARGLSLCVLGYLIRVQMWQLDGAAIVDPPQLAAGLVLAGGYLGLYLGLLRWADHGARPTTLSWLLGGLIASGVGLALAGRVAGPHYANLLRFDVLQGLGLTAALLAPLRACRPGTRGLWAAALGGTVLAATPALRAWVPGPLSPALAAPLAAWDRPTGSPWSMFPLFPWASYGCFGVVVGIGVARARRSVGSAGRLMLALAAGGVALGWLTSEDLPRVTQALKAQPALTEPARMAYRFGVGLVALALAWGWVDGRALRDGSPAARQARMPPLLWPLIWLGRASLWVYWIHLEFAFGAPATPLRRQLDPGGWGLGLAALALSMIGLAWGLERVRERPRNGPPRVGRELAGNLGQRA